MKTILILCDGNSQAGLGHVSRCLGIAEALRDQGAATIFVGEFRDDISGLIETAGFSAVACEQGQESDTLLTLVQREKASACLIDSYQLGEAWLVDFRSAYPGNLILIDDDKRLNSYEEFDVVINFTIGAADLKYGSGNTLLGPRYFPARKWLRELAMKNENRSASASNLLIFMGGYDSAGATSKLLNLLSQLNLKLNGLVIFDSNVHDASAVMEVDEGCREIGFRRVDLQSDLRNEFEWADFCVLGGGLTKYEALYSGLPSAVVNLSDIQALDTRHFVNQEAVMDLGDASQLGESNAASFLKAFLTDQTLREGFEVKGRELFSGDSALNLTEEILDRIETAA